MLHTLAILALAAVHGVEPAVRTISAVQRPMLPGPIMHGATLLLIILTAGLASQWLAWRLRLPTIVVLIAAGLLLGPASGLVEIALSPAEFTELIGLGVAIILFGGGMGLTLGELRRVGHGIGRLTVLGPPLSWLLGGLAAHYVGGLSWPVAWVLGAILVVTGPTVITPLVRQARLNKASASLLKWEGISNDPVGVLLSVLFIVIPAQLEPRHFELLDWRFAGFVLVILFLVRPLTVALATIRAPMRREDKVLLAWIAPRGIVAAAAASIFGPAMVAGGHGDAERLLPIIFLVIIVTALAHGLTIGPVTRRLKLAAQRANGLLIVGANRWTHALALTLRDLGVDVLVVDSAHDCLEPLRRDGIDVYYGEILSEHAEHELDTQHLSYLLAATDNDLYNALVCQARGDTFGRHRTFQLATHQESGQATKRMTLQQRGYTAFGPDSDAACLSERLDNGWTIQVERFEEEREPPSAGGRAGARHEERLLLAGLSPDGTFMPHSEEHPFHADRGWRLLYFAPADASKAV